MGDFEKFFREMKEANAQDGTFAKLWSLLLIVVPLMIGYFNNWEVFRKATASIDIFNWNVALAAVMFTVHFTGIFMLTGSFALDKLHSWSVKYTVWISISSVLLVLAFFIAMKGASNAETEAYICYLTGLTGYFTLLIGLAKS